MSLIFITFVVFSVTCLPSCFSVDQQYEMCRSPMKCGSQSTGFPNKTYPFWGNEINKPDYCGQSPFKLFCKDNQTLTLEIVNQTLRLLSMNLENSTITVADESLFDSGCPVILNFTENIHFTLAPSTSMIDLFVCSNTTSSLSTFSCNISNDSRKTYHVFGPLSNPDQDCVKTGEIPMLKSSKSGLQQSNVELRMALEQGFDLMYERESQTCQSCKFSRGICGSESGTQSFQCLCEDKPQTFSCDDDLNLGGGIVRSAVVLVAIIFGCGFFGAILIAGCLFCCFRRRKRQTSRITRHHNLDALIEIKRYSYAEVKKITKSFSHTVGKGGFGHVYGGNLKDGRKVAVKILKDMKSTGEDFINEVASMSQTSHVNIVSLLGFCYEGSKRAIVYEFLENGSLDQFISKKNSLNLDVSTLFRIALGVARGLEYLHHGCKTRIVHFDIKPQNVLLDDSFCPKVSDFGLAKLCEKRESILSLLDTRGTIGYIAPEVFSGMYGRISHKSDVYSYGMLVLEMIGARDNETNASNSSSSYFPDWIYKNLENGDHILKHCDEITREEKEIAKKMTLVGLWCIQPCPSNRPPMNKVVEMMEGSLDSLQVPPKPSLNISTLSFPESSSLSEENSNYTEVLI